MRRWPLLLAALLALSAHGEIVVATVAPFSGPLGVNGEANFAGATACVGEVNASGGVAGERLKLVKEDDRYDPATTVRLLQEVAQRNKPVAFINLLGSANVAAVIKDGVLERLKVPAVGVTPGAEILRTPGSRWIFHTHAGDSAQIARILEHLSSIGIQRIAVAYQGIPFGAAGLKAMEDLAPRLKVEIVQKVAVPSAGEDLKDVAATLKASRAQAYVMVLVPNSGAAMVRDVRASEDNTPIYSMSYVPAKLVLDKAGASQSAGLALAQVTPNADSPASGLVRDFKAAMGKFVPGAEQTQLHLIGYLGCRTLVAGLRAVRGKADPQALQAALMKVRTDLGGYALDFAGGNVGSRFVDIGVIGRDGRLRY
ncbi:ABC transporter substrate-binding protein [Ramlibacter humi]|nr:ABC transporter substrate-binding protein [Ramlibacter humi]